MLGLNLNHFAIPLAVLILIRALVGCVLQAAETTAPTPPAVQPADSPLPSPSATAAGRWEQVSRIQSPTMLRMAAFIDASSGITGGPSYHGVAHTTNDGGQTWTVAGDSSGCLFGLEIIDAKTMWECNASDVRVTTDGGQTWTDRPRGPGSPGCKISAIDARTAWVVLPEQFIVTHDGGVTREALVLPGNRWANQIAAVSFRSQTDGYILDAAGRLYVTADGGRTWETMPPLDFSQYGSMKLLVNNGQPYAALRFFDADHGLMIVSLAGRGASFGADHGLTILTGRGASMVIALQTADGGQTWNEHSIRAPYGTPYLSHDGKYLTMVSAFTNAGREVTIFRYIGE